MTSINQNNLSPNNTDATTVGQPTRWSIKQLLDWTTDFFKQHGTDQPRLAAEILLAESIGCGRIDLYTRFDDEPTQVQKAAFRDWVRRHGEGEPVAYLVGHREFFSLKFIVNSHVLIPRPETEHLVTETLDRLGQIEKPAKEIWIADVGTGCGNIAIAIAKNAPEVNLVAIDRSEEALRVARENARLHELDQRIQMVCSDLFDEVRQPDKFDFIVSNPPYIGLDEKGSLDKSVVGYEPHDALFSGGPSGFETVQQLVSQSESRLVDGGFLIIEISPMIAHPVAKIFQDARSFGEHQVIKDLAGLERVVVAVRR